tara:strand:- start:75 stop:224 length:150 start_codon:yes stop_codon:yes gene_type:complete
MSKKEKKEDKVAWRLAKKIQTQVTSGVNYRNTSFLLNLTLDKSLEESVT